MNKGKEIQIKKVSLSEIKDSLLDFLGIKNTPKEMTINLLLEEFKLPSKKAVEDVNYSFLNERDLQTIKEVSTPNRKIKHIYTLCMDAKFHLERIVEEVKVPYTNGGYVFRRTIESFGKITQQTYVPVDDGFYHLLSSKIIKRKKKPN
jgi:hypothetical protein